jgi:NAD(P)-dependent dehydrogenase (short-subunit alcohol dehydrogenase family)
MSKTHVVIVGGSSGIGLATAGRLRDDHQVTIIGRDPERLAAAGRRVPEARTLSADAADPASIAGAFSAIGGFDHLVLALGSRRGGGPFAEIGMQEVRLGFAEKVFPQFQAAQLALPHLSATGSITFIGAMSAHAAMPGVAGIGAANAAVEALVPVLAVELKPRRVNAVSPGVIDTPWWDFVPEEQKRAGFAQYAGITPVGRVGTADDVADAIAFLIGNGFMDGQVLLCDGGLTLAA